MFHTPTRGRIDPHTDYSHDNECVHQIRVFTCLRKRLLKKCDENPDITSVYSFSRAAKLKKKMYQSFGYKSRAGSPHTSLWASL